jgi:hypothetical protein
MAGRAISSIAHGPTASGPITDSRGGERLVGRRASKRKAPLYGLVGKNERKDGLFRRGRPSDGFANLRRRIEAISIVSTDGTGTW